ncbi:MAG: restriction endonuclease [Anaerolineae bacterium]|nr:restriction endonuclease [Anaerolineae bacterium]
MIKRSHIRKKRKPPATSTRAKGDMVEQVVASMHSTPNVKVETNVFLYAQDESGRRREIDVLVSSQVAGYPVHIAIECKNEKKPTGTKQIDEFIGKLEDVGLPTQLGIFVSASRFTKDAVLRARRIGITTLLLKDTTASLSPSVRQAFQSILYLLLSITSIEIRNDIPGPAGVGDLFFFRDSQGAFCGSVGDLVWLKWQQGEIASEIGPYQTDLSLPAGWQQVINGQVANVTGIHVEVQVTGHMVTFPGSVHQHDLVRTSDHGVDRQQIVAEFDSPPAGSYPVSTFMTEEDFLAAGRMPSRGMRLTVGRFRLPRIRWMKMYWPPSKRALQKLVILAQEALEKGEKLDLASLPPDDIEGSDLRVVWEAIIPDHPLAEGS